MGALQNALVAAPILVLNRVSGADLGSIFLNRGNLKLGLGIGALVFFFLAPASFMFAAQRFSSAELLMAAVVWGLVFSVANSFMEELWLRGIFLKRRVVPLGGDLDGIDGLIHISELSWSHVNHPSEVLNAASIAGLLLTTECVVVERKEEKATPAGAGGGMGGGMGGMY